ncbi:immunoglobulin-like domain-containing protein [Listeria rocourtiae]|uniref:immunoglobulin-like domain-containing protein n=1 Tax=Listeria rocourtiae TaxID=647910 RepID=UPI003D2F8561
MKKNMLKKILTVVTATTIVGSGTLEVVASLPTTQAQASVLPALDSKWEVYRAQAANGGLSFNGNYTMTNSVVKLTQANYESYSKTAVNASNNLEVGKEYEIFYSTKATTTVAKHYVDVRVMLGTLSQGGRALSSGAKFKMTKGSLIMIDVATKNAAGTAMNYNFDVEVSGLTIQKTQAQVEKDALEEANNKDKVAQDDAREAVNDLFENKNPQGLITEYVTQESIDKAKELVDKVVDSTIKQELAAYIAEAQAQLDVKMAEVVAEQARQEAATDAVKNLFNNNDVTGTIKDSTTQEAIDQAKELLVAVTSIDKKAELEAQIAEAQKQLDAKAEEGTEKTRQEVATDAVKNLFNNNDVTGTIKDSTTQEAIDQAKELVAAITDAAKKAELESQIEKAQQQLTEKETKVEVTGKGNTFTLQQDRYLTGTYTGDVSSMSVDINGKRYYGGTVKSGEFSFYALDKIAKETDEVMVNLHGADKSIQTTFVVIVKVPTKITPNAYKLKDSNITGAFNNPDITKMNIVVNGKTYWGGTLANGEFKFYALDKITSATDEVTMNFFNAKNELIISKNLTIVAPVVTSGEITSATVAVGDKNIIGTITGDIKSFGVTIDGTTYNGGTITGDGTFKFYVADKKFTADSIITIVGYDKSKNALSEMALPVTK